jgi:nitronate monooxygenase
VVDAVKIPVIAAGGIAEARAIVASLTLGASAVQLGTAYLFCPEAKIHPTYLKTLKSPAADHTALTNIFSGRPARAIVNRLVREVGPMSDVAPEFPQAGAAIAPLRAKSEAASSPDFMQMWSGQAARYGREMPAAELTRKLAEEVLSQLSRKPL